MNDETPLITMVYGNGGPLGCYGRSGTHVTHRTTTHRFLWIRIFFVDFLPLTLNEGKGRGRSARTVNKSTGGN